MKTPTEKQAPTRKPPGMTKDEREAFERGFKRNEEALRRLAKL